MYGHSQPMLIYFSEYNSQTKRLVANDKSFFMAIGKFYFPIANIFMNKDFPLKNTAEAALFSFIQQILWLLGLEYLYPL
jgi:hypothetical protein